MKQYSQFYSCLRYLRKHLKFSHPVQVRRTDKLPDDIDGDCSFHQGKFHVRIRKTLPEYYAIDVLVHEISHCLAWNSCGHTHNLCWGKAYSRAYRTFLKWIEQQ